MMARIKTRGIVLKYIKFRETSIIATVFTEIDGMRTYLVPGVRSKKPRVSIALFEPLTLLEIVGYHKDDDGLSKISEVKCEHPYDSIPLDLKKSGIALFLSEMLTKVLRHESHPEDAFPFVRSSILTLDSLESGFENFHIHFLLRFTRYLGFWPLSGADLKDQLTHGDPELEEEINQFLSKEFTDRVSLSNSQRRDLLANVIGYYKLHLEGIGKVKSTAVLHEVLSA